MSFLNGLHKRRSQSLPSVGASPLTEQHKITTIMVRPPTAQSSRSTLLLGESLADLPNTRARISIRPSTPIAMDKSTKLNMIDKENGLKRLSSGNHLMPTMIPKSTQQNLMSKEDMRTDSRKASAITNDSWDSRDSEDNTFTNREVTSDWVPQFRIYKYDFFTKHTKSLVGGLLCLIFIITISVVLAVSLPNNEFIGKVTTSVLIFILN